MNYNQHSLIEKLNSYLKLKNRSLTFKSGYCHGITLLWLYKTAIGKQEWFYRIADEIVNCTTDEDFAEAETDIEKFIAHIEWLQNSARYMRGVNQLDIDKLMEIPGKFSISFLFSQKDLESILPKIIQDNKLICMSGPMHTIGIYKTGGGICLLDSNYNRLRHKVFQDLTDLKREIIKCLFKDNVFNSRMPLEINVMNHPDAELNQAVKSNEKPLDKESIYQELIGSLKNINMNGYGGITNLHLACESGDTTAVSLLLKHGANPNQVCKSEWTPLLVAAGKGYLDIVKLLLEYGASPDLANPNGITPLRLAAKHCHDDIVTLLLNKITAQGIASQTRTLPSKAHSLPEFRLAQSYSRQELSAKESSSYEHNEKRRYSR